jgi:serine/threonine protein kinase
VYEARDRRHGSRLALKLLRTFTPDSLLRFKNEFRALQEIQHRNLVALGELIEEQGQWYYTMEYVEGVEFQRYVRGTLTADDGGTAPTRVTPIDEKAAQAPAPPSRRESRPTPEGPPRFDETRLREALHQLALGVSALHEAGKVHRDIKPSNVLVTSDGRVVILDFGIIADVTGDRLTGVNQIVGTADYMAPEQGAAKTVGPAADWYAVGVVLYRALTGHLPFEGSALDVIREKQHGEPPRPREVAPAVPPDLDELCMRLLRADPSKRPTGPDVLRVLAGHAPAPQKSTPPTTAAPFVGRQRELGALLEAFRESRTSGAMTVSITGESGVGKTALVRHFIDHAVTSDTVVLAGRCYEREFVPYKAFDGILDALTGFLLRTPRSDVLLPRHVKMLAQIFPVLATVPAIADAPAISPEQLDPLELRGRAFAALRELLARIADRVPLVLTIDDFQWADPDSLSLLTELLRPPDAPRLLLVVTARGEVSLPGGVRSLSLQPLSPDEGRALAMDLVKRWAPRGIIDAQAIATEASGHPLFIGELVRYSMAHGQTSRGVIRLEDALSSRIEALDPTSAEILALLATAGAPVRLEILARAAAVADFTALTKQVQTLRLANLVKAIASHGDSYVLEVYHDRVRQTLLGHLPPTERARRHERLAEALEASDQADPEALFFHWHGAGNRQKAARFAVAAAAEAARQLAFDRAARLYATALELGGRGDRDLLIRHADALANAGRGVEAAEAYLEAAVGADPALAIDLRRRASEGFLRSGHVDRGLDTVRGVLREVGISLPKTPTRALLALLWQRARLRLGGLRYRPREPAALPAGEATRIDVVRSAAMSLGLIDTLRGTDFQSRNVILSLRSGVSRRIALALPVEAIYSATVAARSARRTERILRMVETIAGELDDPYVRAHAGLGRGVTSFLQGRWRSCRDSCEATERLLRDRCTGVFWEIASMQLFALWALFYLGELDELGRRLPACLREADERGDLYEVASLRSANTNVAWLVRDEPAIARQQVQAAEREWTHQGYHLQHWFFAFAHAQIDLYENQPQPAYERVCKSFIGLRKSFLLRIEHTRVEALFLRARTALACGLVGPAEADARRLARHGLEWARPAAALIRAGVAAKKGDRSRATERLDEAVSRFEAAEMAAFAAVARRRRAELAGTVDEAANEWMRRQGIRNPDRFTTMLAPGF